MTKKTTELVRQQGPGFGESGVNSEQPLLPQHLIRHQGPVFISSQQNSQRVYRVRLQRKPALGRTRTASRSEKRDQPRTES